MSPLLVAWLASLLLHAVWVGCVVGLLAMLGLGLARGKPGHRHATALAAMAALVVALLAIGWSTWPRLAPVVEPLASPVPVAALADAIPSTVDEPDPPADTRADWRPCLVLVWLVGVTLVVLWQAVGWWHVRRWQRARTPADAAWSERLARLAQRCGISAPPLAFCTRIRVPMVCGWWRPMLLLPLGLATGLTQAQVDALLLHELAHIRRRDWIPGLLCAILETVLFFHPAIWWLGRVLRQAREECCDAAAVQAGGDGLDLAQGLVALAADLSAAAPVLAARRGPVGNRVARLLGQPTRSWSPARALVAVLALPATIAAIAACSATVVQRPAVLPPAQTVHTPVGFASVGFAQAIARIPLAERIRARNAPAVTVQAQMVTANTDALVAFDLPLSGVPRHLPAAAAQRIQAAIANATDVVTLAMPSLTVHALRSGFCSFSTESAHITDYALKPAAADARPVVIPGRTVGDLCLGANGRLLPDPTVAVLRCGSTFETCVMPIDDRVRLIGVRFTDLRLLTVHILHLQGHCDGTAVDYPVEEPETWTWQAPPITDTDLEPGAMLAVPLLGSLHRARASIRDLAPLTSMPSEPSAAVPPRNQATVLLVTATVASDVRTPTPIVTTSMTDLQADVRMAEPITDLVAVDEPLPQVLQRLAGMITTPLHLARCPEHRDLRVNLDLHHTRLHNVFDALLPQTLLRAEVGTDGIRLIVDQKDAAPLPCDRVLPATAGQAGLSTRHYHIGE